MRLQIIILKRYDICLILKQTVISVNKKKNIEK